MDVIYLFKEEWHQLRHSPPSVRKKRIDPFRIRVGNTVFMRYCGRSESPGYVCKHPIPESSQCLSCPAATPGK